MSVSAADIIVPCFKPNAHLLARCLQKIEEHTDVPHTILVIGDGFIAEEVVSLRKMLAEFISPHQLVRSHVVTFPQPVYLKRCVNHALTFLSQEAPIAVFVPPNLHLEDPAWFGKVQAPLMQDGLAAAVFFGCSDYNFSVDPVRVETYLPSFSGIALSRRFLTEAKLDQGEWSNLSTKVSDTAAEVGCTCWAVQSVACELYTATPHVPRPVLVHPAPKVGSSTGTTPRNHR